MIPATMTHELAYQCGFMYEDEDNFIAYLACRQQDDPIILTVPDINFKKNTSEVRMRRLEEN
ncbi:DUF3810 domain-containing protein [Acetobacterium wieringae]|uniref:DUF3810 domain-containing protein n=2 Tax=Acetobacterium wieringae TaxID=52694 RepID=A0A5D0WKQ5_9FIRM|nr:DUF3810 domain-containing protein [Acetobacterium wieringae]